MEYKNFRNISLSCLGLGNMRFPLLDPDNFNAIDYTKAHRIIDMAYENGVNYYDTAYVYNGGDSEKCLGAAMLKYPRDSFYIATKLNLRANPDYEAQFEEQLARLQTDHVDFYLMHCLLDSNIDMYLESGAIEYMLEQQKLGRITYFGFSSHASPAVLKRFTEHHDWDFAQIEFNYYDWLYGTAREEYEILAEKNLPVMIMEPVRGGRLASLTPEAEAMLKEAHPDWSVASWAMRFVKRFPAVQVVLSGMNSEEQMNDNVATFSDTDGLSDEDTALLLKACEVFRSNVILSCTGCRYCENCPSRINIPEYLNLYNSFVIDGKYALSGAKKIVSDGKPADCIGCGSCTSHCPQSINTPEIMKKLAELLK